MTHCVKVSSRSLMFPWKRSRCKIRRKVEYSEERRKRKEKRTDI